MLIVPVSMSVGRCCRAVRYCMTWWAQSCTQMVPGYQRIVWHWNGWQRQKCKVSFITHDQAVLILCCRWRRWACKCHVFHCYTCMIRLIKKLINKEPNKHRNCGLHDAHIMNCRSCPLKINIYRWVISEWILRINIYLYYHNYTTLR